MKGYFYPLLSRFCAIKARCNNPNTINYARYGGKGIKCEWKTYKEFFADMYPSYSEHIAIHGKRNTQIDRIDPSKNYCKENCRWATLKEQSNNRKGINRFTFNGRTLTLTEWSKEIGISFSALYTRIHREGWSIEKALTTGKKINQFL